MHPLVICPLCNIHECILLWKRSGSDLVLSVNQSSKHPGSIRGNCKAESISVPRWFSLSRDINSQTIIFKLFTHLSRQWDRLCSTKVCCLLCNCVTCNQEKLGTKCLDQALSILWSFPPQETYFFSFKGNILRQENAFLPQNKNIHSLFLAVSHTPVADRVIKVDRGCEGRKWCRVSTNALYIVGCWLRSIKHINTLVMLSLHVLFNTFELGFWVKNIIILDTVTVVTVPKK